MRETKKAPQAPERIEQMATLVPAGREGRASSGFMQFRILGPLEVDAGSGPIPLGGPKQRTVLAHLLIRANELVPNETLVGEVWGEEPPEKGRNVIQTYVSQLRKALGPDRIQGQAPGYRLRLDASESDAARFDTLVRDAKKALPVDPTMAVGTLEDALALWRGPALADLADQPSLAAEATRLDEGRLEAQEDRIEGLLASGAQVRAIGETESLLAHHPWRESLWGLLMVALYREGRQAEALNAYQRAREILADELGIDPSPELTKLHERVLGQDPGLDLRGEPLRGYRLLEKIDDGPTGVVFRAIQPHVERDVAVKIFHERVASDPAFVRRFEQEAQAAAALEHPHIAPIYDYWREPGRAYIVSRYFRGGSLRALEERGEPLERDRAAGVVEQIASALAFAHRQGLAHGSVRPSNVLFDPEGNAYLGDFPVGVGSEPVPAADVGDLAALARRLLPTMPPRLAEVAERAEAGTDALDADAFAQAARTAFEPETVPGPRRVDERNPYKGLRAFTEADARDFFGRGALTQSLVAGLRGDGPGSRFLAVVGPSGGGKSSVVRAGLVPEIRRGALGDPESSFIAEMFPGAHPIEELEAALLRIAVRPASGLLDRLDAGSRGLLEAVDLVAPGTTDVVLVVDQFEEVFTLATDERERELFLESLRVATADPDSRLRVVVTLRADFYDRPLVYPRFGELLAARTEAVPPLTPDELEQAIRRPAEQVGVSPEPGLVAEMIADVAHQPGALPLLQYALTELFERRDDDRLTLATYQEIGGVAGALSARADRIVETSDADGRRAVKQVFLRLVTLGEGRQDTRRRVARSELDALEVEPEAIEAALDAFGRHRFLTFDREPATREPTVEIAHEALLGAWGRLRTWIEGAREDLRLDRRLVRAAAEWRGSGRDPSFLMRGVRLEQVETWAEATDLALGRPERAYLKASVDERDRERDEEERRREHEAQVERRSVRRLRGLVAVFAVAAIVAGSLTIVATRQSEKARDAAAVARTAETAQLAQRLGAQALVEEDLDLALLLARQAVAIDDSSQTRGYLLAALRRSPDAMAIMHGTYLLKATALSPDGKTLAVIGETDGLLLFDTGTYRQIGNPLPLSGRLESVTYSPDGRTLAVGGDGVRLLDARTHELLTKAKVLGTVWRLAFTNDGSRLVVLDATRDTDDARITIRDAATLRPIGPSIVPDAFVGVQVGFRYAAPHFALTPDDRSLVTASEDGELAVWDLRSGEKTRTIPIRTGLHALALSPDGRTAAVGTDRGIQLVDLPPGAVGTATDTLNGRPTWLRFSPDGDALVSTSLNGTVTLWDVVSATPRETLRGHSNSVQQPVFSPDGQTLYTVSHDGTAIAWDMTGERGLGRPFTFTHDRRSRIAALGYEGHPGEFSPDGRLIAVGLQGRGIALWDARKLTPVGGPLLGTGGEVKSLAFSPDGRTLAAAAFGEVLTLWDVGSRSRLFHERITDIDFPFVGVGFSPDGRTLAMTAGSGVRLLDVATGSSLDEIGAGLGDPAFSADGTMIATARGWAGGADVWDVATGASIASVDAVPAVPQVGPSDWTVALSPDGRTLAVGGLPPIVRLVDVRTGKLLHELDTDGAFSLEFSSDGQTLAVSGWEAVASLWDVATGTQIGPRLTAGSRRTLLDLSPDGRRLLMTLSNGEGAVWDIDPASWVRRACMIANRTLTFEEWGEYLPGRPYEPACR